MWCDIISQILKNTASICHKDTCDRKRNEHCILCMRKEAILTRYRVEFAYFIHVGEGKNQFVLDWHATSNQTGIAALWDDTNSALVAPFENITDLLGCFWLEDGS